jgi:hypothetical protein
MNPNPQIISPRKSGDINFDKYQFLNSGKIFTLDGVAGLMIELKIESRLIAVSGASGR